MGIFNRLLGKNTPQEPDTPTENTKLDVRHVRGLISGKIQELLERDGEDAWSDTEDMCLKFCLKLQAVLPDLRMVQIQKTQNTITHYFLRTPDGLIVDPTWQQFLRGELPWMAKKYRQPMPVGLPRVFIGTREQLIEMIRPHANLLLSRDNKRPTPEEFVDEQYGFGVFAGNGKDLTDFFRNNPTVIEDLNRR